MVMIFQYPQSDRTLCNNHDIRNRNSHIQLSVSATGSNPLQPRHHAKKICLLRSLIPHRTILITFFLLPSPPAYHHSRKSFFAPKPHSICEKRYRRPAEASLNHIITKSPKLTRKTLVPIFHRRRHLLLLDDTAHLLHRTQHLRSQPLFDSYLDRTS